MSCVTDVVIFSHEWKDVAEPIAKLNAWLTEKCGNGKLVRVDQLGTGGKVMQIDIHIAAVNYLPLQEFIEQVEKAGWGSPSSVQLCVQQEDDFSMRFVKLNMPPEPVREPLDISNFTGSFGVVDSVIFLTRK